MTVCVRFLFLLLSADTGLTLILQDGIDNARYNKSNGSGIFGDGNSSKALLDAESYEEMREEFIGATTQYSMKRIKVIFDVTRLCPTGQVLGHGGICRDIISTPRCRPGQLWLSQWKICIPLKSFAP